MSVHPDDKKKKKKVRLIKQFRLDEISLVDEPAHAPARIAIMKRKKDSPEEIQKNRLAVTDTVDGHAHTLVLTEGAADLRLGSTTWSDGHTHDWVRDENGNITILDAEGHSHGLTALIKAADGVTNEILAESMLASIDQNESPASVTKAATGPMDNIMTDEEKAEFTKAADNKLNVEKARADRAEQIVKLSPDQRAHYEALSADNQGTFLKAENKDAILKNAEAADPVEHVNLDGIEIRKSEGAAFIKLAKSHDELRKQVATSNAPRSAHVGPDRGGRGSEIGVHHLVGRAHP